jgi:hypothetical protein
MAAKDEGLTLEGLAQMLETQAQQLETLQHENAELRGEVTARRVSGTHRDEVAEMRGSGTGQSVEPAPEADGVVSRRALLGKAGAAVAAIAAGTLLYPREARANHFGPGIEVDYLRAHSDNGDAVYAVSGNTDLSTGRRGVFGYAYNPDWAGVEGGNTNGIGVRGYGDTGVRGEGDTGVWGSSNRGGWSGVYGQHTGTSGYGIVGDGKGATPAERGSAVRVPRPRRSLVCGAKAKPACGAARLLRSIRACMASTPARQASGLWETARGKPAQACSDETAPATAGSSREARRS